MPRISISATNPCHLWHLARELAARDGLGFYYSGYPAWKLPGSEKVPVRALSWQTLITYGLLKMPEKWRPANRTLFQWQDGCFDRRVARCLEPADYIHAMPGQALKTFRRARQLGVVPVLNHATGPTRYVEAVLRAEYERAGRRYEVETRFDSAYYEREEEEYALSHWHCCASSLVREQLVASGIARERIWTLAYAADPLVFFPPAVVAAREEKSRRIVFAGMLSLRKGIRFLLRALELAGNEPWHLDFFGTVLDEIKPDLANYRGSIPLHFHGAVSQSRLADEMRQADLLVLPSLEDGFGLVVVQALSCGLPCLVSDAVGAVDLIEAGMNGDRFPAGEAEPLMEVMKKSLAKTWNRNQISHATPTWGNLAERLMELSPSLL